MENKPDLSDRMFAFAVAVVGITGRLPRTVAGRNTAGQLFRAGTSSASNYEEACAAESRMDFIDKLQIVLKELRESRSWLRLILETGMLPRDLVIDTYTESNEFCNIIGQSIVTARRNLKRG